jgi:DNA recombination protein RmuC
MTGWLMVGLGGGLLVGAIVGASCALLWRARADRGMAAAVSTAEARLADARAESANLAAECQALERELREAHAEAARCRAELEADQRAAHDRVATLQEDRERLSGAFAEVSGRALKDNAEQFLVLADARMREAQEAARGDLAQRQDAIAQLLRPLHETLSRYESGLRQLELDRRGAYDGLNEQLRLLGVSHERLQRETGNLVTALRSPQTRGRWGEMQLRRVVEMAGMLMHCDFEEQVSVDTPDGRLRPDVVIHMPGGADVVVDAKVPLDAFLRASDATDEDERAACMAAHARQLRAHVDQLAKKEYWSQFDPSPELVVAFIPGDPLLSAAFEQDPDLVEHAMANKVLLTTPTTLIALLRAIAHGWQQDQLADSARLVQRLGAELYERLRVVGGHLGKLQRGLSSTVEAYNDTVASLESRVLVTARKFPELGVVGVGTKEIPDAGPVLATPRLAQAPELCGESPELTGGETAAQAHPAGAGGVDPELPEAALPLHLHPLEGSGEAGSEHDVAG